MSMNPERGKFIAIEGIDGSGKGTQSALLSSRLMREGINNTVFSFPTYEKSYFGKLTGRLLNGEFGSIKEINPYLFSIPFALDRWQAAPQIEAALSAGTWVVTDRYVLSNLAHQSAKLLPEKRKQFIDYEREMEYEIMGIPKEDLDILLYVNYETGRELVDSKKDRRYLDGKKRDIQEEDLEHQHETSKVYLSLVDLLPNVKMINCYHEGQLMAREQIHELVWGEVKKSLNPSREGQIIGERQR